MVYAGTPRTKPPTQAPSFVDKQGAITFEKVSTSHGDRTSAADILAKL